jgi:hypothetical protein
LWYGEGVLSADQLNQSSVMSWNLAAESEGYYGFYFGQVTLPDWQPGDTYTFQIRLGGNTIYGPIDSTFARSVLWQERMNIGFLGGNPPGLPGVSTNSIGIFIPEPSAFTLGSLAFAALFSFRWPKVRPRPRGQQGGACRRFWIVL